MGVILRVWWLCPDCQSLLTLLLTRNMEGRKKSARASLEEKQMKRYFRSIKRSKGKNKKESSKVNEEIGEMNKKTSCVSITNVRDKSVSITNVRDKSVSITNLRDKSVSITNVRGKSVSIPIVREKSKEVPRKNANDALITNARESTREAQLKDALISTKSEPAEQNMDNESLEDLADWEIVQNPKDNLINNEDENYKRLSISCLDNEEDETDDKPLVTIDYNTSQVDEVHRDTENIPIVFVEQPKNNDVTTDAKPEDALILSNKEEEDIEQPKNEQEFSPIVYWRDPLPDLAPLEVEHIRHQDVKYLHDNVPDVVQNWTSYVYSSTNENENKNGNSKSKNKKEKSKSGELKETSIENNDLKKVGKHSLGFENVWLDKTKYDDAEVKHYQRLATQLNKAVKREKGSNKSSNRSKMIGTKKARDAEMITDQKTEVNQKSMKEKTDNLSPEEHLQILELENTEFSQSLSQLSTIVRSLEERVTHLEGRSLSSSLTDEGVDMTEESRCTFFDDCICADNISLNDGSEFEEFTAATAVDNSETGKDNLWQDDWDDLSGCDLAAELGRNSRKRKI